MRRLMLCTALAAALWSMPARAEEKKSETAGESGSMKAWEWANFLVLAGGLGYIIRKQAGPAFEARGRHIRKEMLEAQAVRKEADGRAAAVEARMARLAEEIAALRAEAQREEEAENARYARQTAAEIAKIQAHAEQEIASAGKAARMELQRYAAELALAMAERQVRDRMTPETEDGLVRGFLKHLVESPSAEDLN